MPLLLYLILHATAAWGHFVERTAVADCAVPLLGNFSATLYHGFVLVQSLGFRPDSLSIAALVFDVEAAISWRQDRTGFSCAGVRRESFAK